MKTVTILFAVGLMCAACSKTELATTKPELRYLRGKNFALEQETYSISAY